MALTDKLVAIADQVRRISGVTDELTLEQMETNLLNVTVGAELPDAEEAAFGSESGELEHGILTNISAYNHGAYPHSFGWKITAGEAFAIVGLRHKYNSTTKMVKLWNEAGELIASAKPSTKASDDWYECELDTPINIAIGETFTVSAYDPNAFYVNKKGIQFNAKFAEVTGMSKYNSDTFPNEVSEYPIAGANSGGPVDIIIAPIIAPLPDSYEIQRDTLDDIAEEVQRITGVTTKLNTAQILTALQGIQLQSKTVTPTDTEQTITPDDGYYGLSSVVVGAAAGEVLEDLSEVAF